MSNEIKISDAFSNGKAFIGFLTTIKLAMIYYDVNFNEYALPSFCSVNDFIDCDGIAKTTESQFLGVPLAYWGMFFSAFIAGSFLPFSSEAVMIGLLAAKLDPWTLVFFGTAGNWAGSMFNYFVGRQGKMEWIREVSWASF